eukprot:TRINITY_DN4006_c0_g1_i8.p1 TRINITY_DN4006_c0_g1~~TRINITY_DN4006_c0_g1_i8.p1  ORF type:complete len:312 (+),score=57.79 TRINITY_DN4006_c0_g1_i8:467-1402(+)
MERLGKNGYFWSFEDCLPQQIQGPCPVCNEYNTYDRNAKEITCHSCQAQLLTFIWADRQSSCATCQKSVYKLRGEKTMLCDNCNSRTSIMVCDLCGTTFPFAVGIQSMPCLSCKKSLDLSNILHTTPPRLGLLVPKEVNVSDPYKQKFLARKPKNSVVNLIVQYYRDTSIDRQREIDEALENNMKCEAIDVIHLLLEKKEHFPKKFTDNSKLKVSYLGHRWKFCDAFKYCNTSLKGQICIIANSDMFYDHTLYHLHRSPVRGEAVVSTQSTGNYLPSPEWKFSQMEAFYLMKVWHRDAKIRGYLKHPYPLK